MSTPCNCNLPALDVQRLDIALKQGEDRSIALNWSVNGTPVPLSGYVFTMDLRAYVGGAVLLALSSAAATPGGSTIALTTDASGNYTVKFGHIDTAALPYSSCGHVVALYDIKAVSPAGVVTYLYQGYIYVSAAITP